MQKLLTIAIPSYNRSAKLDVQLYWLRDAVKGFEKHCELIVSDNASKDDTPHIMEAWREVFGDVLRVRRNPRNIGALGNIAACIREAKGRFVWVIGDDDEVSDLAVSFVVRSLQSEPALAMLSLNFASTGVSVYDRCFDWPADAVLQGRDFIETALRTRYFGLAFMTAQVYRTEFARQAVDSWPDGTWNYDYQLYISAHVALNRQVRVTRDTWCTYVTGYNVYETDPRAALSVAGDTSEVLVRLARLGYDQRLCASVVRRHARRFGPRFWLRARKKPLAVPGILLRYLKALVQIHLPTVTGATAPTPQVSPVY
jgi:abequosyltransferase